MPDLALVGAWVTLFYCLFLFQGYQKLFRDSDAGWHIRTGEAILSSGGLPRGDPYSFTARGKPWYAWEWGADVVSGAVHRAAGPGGVAMLYGCLIALSTWLWFRLHRAMGGNFFLACAMAPLLLSTTNIHWLARPHIFSWVFLVATIWLATWHRLQPVHLLVCAAGGALWANLHASFFFGPLIFLLYAIGCLIRPLIWAADRRTEFRRAGWFGAMAAAAAAGTLLNPYGLSLHTHVFKYLTDTALLSRIGEFQSFNFHAEGAWQIVAALLVLVAGAGLAFAGKRPEHCFLMLLIAAGAMRSARALPLVALLLPLANAAITDRLRVASGLRPSLRRRMDEFLAYSDRLQALDRNAGGWAVAWTVPVLLFLLLQSPGIAARTGFPPDQFPVVAASAVAQLPAGARLFAPDKFGGYLIYRFSGERKVFFDGRSDLYGAEFLKRYARMVQVRPGWREIWDSFGFTHALLPNDYSLIPALRALGWREIYRDGTATLLEAPGAAPELKAAQRVTNNIPAGRQVGRVPARGRDAQA